jgi:hypothetical protein
MAVLFAATLSGCTSVSYDYQPPDTERGKQCIVQCASVQEQCRWNESMRANFEKQACDRRADSDFRSCSNDAKNKKQDKKCDDKRDKAGCYLSENFDRCESEYKQCFSNCGGVVSKKVTRSSVLNNPITTSEQVEKTRKATRAALVAQGYRTVPCSSALATLYCDDFTDAQSRISVWINSDDPKTVRMSYSAADTSTDPSDGMLKAVMSAIEPGQN